MDGVHTSHIIWIIGDVISVKVGQDERNIEESRKYSQQRGKTLEKVPSIPPGISGVLYQDVQSSKPTRKGVATHIRPM